MASAPSQELPPGHGDLNGFWGSLEGQPAPLLPQLPCPYPVLPCYSWLHPPPLSLFTQPVPAPHELPVAAAAALWWPGGLALHSPLGRPGAAEEPSPRAQAAASRESTAALKAWLGRHPKNPYPGKGEKMLLALVSGMSLAQVSTWFANARRRLKKEHRACWGGRPPKAAAGEGEEEEGAQEAGGGGAAAPGAPRLEEGDRGRPLSPAPGAPAGPRIWRVAELATRPPPGRAAF